MQSDFRAFTDPYSNSVVLSTLDIRRYLAESFTRQLPLHCFPQFLHEATHHWCFNSPVGKALTFLEMLARRTALRALFKGSIDGESQQAVSHDLAGVTLGYGLMRPLAEGMALFCQYDVVPGDAAVVGKPTVLGGILFSGPKAEPEEILSRLPTLFINARLSSSVARSKANLLIQPFDFSDGGYLPGYMLVKAMWHHSLLREPKFLDSEFFLHYLHAYFYNDWDFVALLLDPNRREFALAEYVEKRISDFWEHTPDASGFEFRGLNSIADEFSYKCEHIEFTSFAHPVDGPHVSEHFGKVRMSTILSELFETIPDEQFITECVSMDRATIILRSLMTLGHADFPARVTKNGMLQLFHEDGGFLFSAAAPEDTTRGWEGRLTVDVVVSMAMTGLYLFFTDGHRVVMANPQDKRIHPNTYQIP